MSAYTYEVGDVLQVLAGFHDNSFDALACDPPYGFFFMGKSWDYDVPSVALWAECLRVLKPGSPLVAFGGSRTYHRLACGVEDAGFELRDQLMWLYGKGFPKSQNIGLAIDKSAGIERADMNRTVTIRETVNSASHRGTHVCNTCGKYYGSAAANCHCPKSKAVSSTAQLWDGYGTALKPAHEPIVLARKPLDGTMVQNVARWGVGGLAIDDCRIDGSGAGTKCTNRDAAGRCLGHNNAGRSTSGETFHGAETSPEGRWPANLLLSHSEQCRATGQCADDCPIRLLDEQAGDRPSNPYRENTASGAVLPLTKRTAGGYADAGGPSRFFYCSKVSTKEREAGCEGLALRSAGDVTERSEHLDGCHAYAAMMANALMGQFEGSNPRPVPSCECHRPAGLDSPRAGAGRMGGARNHHPTLKPLSLTTWLARLIMPPTPGVILVPFAGAGSEMIGALKAGWGGVFGIERDRDEHGVRLGYEEVARARLRHWCPESEAA